MHKPLNTLADIRAGHTFRGQIVDHPQGVVRVLQIRDIKGSSAINPETLPKASPEEVGSAELLHAGEIVLPARGEYYDAVLVGTSAPLLATSQLWVVRLRSRSIVPEYLCWYLNQPTARNYFAANTTGTSIPMLSKQTLGGLPVPVPSLTTQQQILGLQNLWERERLLTEQLLLNRERMLSGMFKQLLES